MLFQNCKYLLGKFHCKCQVDEENNEVYVIFKDDLATIISQKDPDVEPSLTEYNRIDNCGNIRRKGEILCTLSKKLEAVESQIKGTEFYPLYNDTTFLLNKIGARHWTGKDKFVVETKGSIEGKDLRPKEQAKIRCGEKHFAALGNDAKFMKADSFQRFTERLV